MSNCFTDRPGQILKLAVSLFNVVKCQFTLSILSVDSKLLDLSEHPSNVESLSWGNHGQLLASMCKVPTCVIHAMALPT